MTRPRLILILVGSGMLLGIWLYFQKSTSSLSPQEQVRLAAIGHNDVNASREPSSSDLKGWTVANISTDPKDEGKQIALIDWPDDRSESRVKSLATTYGLQVSPVSPTGGRLVLNGPVGADDADAVRAVLRLGRWASEGTGLVPDKKKLLELESLAIELLQWLAADGSSPTLAGNRLTAEHRNWHDLPASIPPELRIGRVLFDSGLGSGASVKMEPDRSPTGDLSRLTKLGFSFTSPPQTKGPLEAKVVVPIETKSEEHATFDLTAIYDTQHGVWIATEIRIEPFIPLMERFADKGQTPKRPSWSRILTDLADGGVLVGGRGLVTDARTLD